MSTLFDHLVPKEDRFHTRVFLETPEGEAFSFNDLRKHSAAYAHVLSAHRVKQGDRIVFIADKSPNFFFFYLGVLRLGAVFVPLNPTYTPRERGEIIEDIAPKFVVLSKPLLCDTETNHQNFPYLFFEDLTKETKHKTSECLDFAPQVNLEAPCAVIYTSGTTGRPKGAVLTGKNLLCNARALCEIWQFSEHDVLLHALPVFHVHGLFVAMHVLLLARGSVFFLPRFTPQDVFTHLHRATTFMGVPTFYHRLLEAPELTRDKTAHMRLFISGSAPLLPKIFEEFRTKTGHTILERYGMSETGMLASNPYGGERRSGTVGFPLPGVSIRIVDLETEHVCASEEIGMVEVAGENIFSGYWQKEKQDFFKEDGFFITGDLGKWDQAGYLHLMGRHKDLVISGGMNVYPQEVEYCLNLFPEILESAVVGFSDPDFGEKVVAFVVLKPTHSLTIKEVKQRLQPVLSSFKHPKEIFFIPSLPKNHLGKIDKKRLRAEGFSQPEENQARE